MKTSGVFKQTNADVTRVINEAHVKTSKVLKEKGEASKAIGAVVKASEEAHVKAVDAPQETCAVPKEYSRTPQERGEVPKRNGRRAEERGRGSEAK